MRYVVALLMMIGSILGLTSTAALASTTPGVNAIPSNNTSHPWTTDGCTLSPDRGPNFDFRHACAHHDGCYSQHWTVRATCDRWFYNDMRATCVSMWSAWNIRRVHCSNTARAYYIAVRTFGERFYAVSSPYTNTA